MCDTCGGIADDEYAQRIEENIRAHGWTVQYVMGDDERNPAFAYTLGLSLRRHPEIITFSCHPDCAYGALRPLAEAVMGGRRFDEGDDLSGFYPTPEKAELLRFPDSSTHLYAANGMFRQPGQPPLPALQLLWPSMVPLLAGVSLGADRKQGGR